MSSLELGELPQPTTAPSSVLELPAINQVQEDNQGNNEESSERQSWSSRDRSFSFGTQRSERKSWSSRVRSFSFGTQRRSPQRSQSSKYQAHPIQQYLDRIYTGFIHFATFLVIPTVYCSTWNLTLRRPRGFRQCRAPSWFSGNDFLKLVVSYLMIGSRHQKSIYRTKLTTKALCVEPHRCCYCCWHAHFSSWCTGL